MEEMAHSLESRIRLCRERLWRLPIGVRRAKLSAAWPGPILLRYG